MNSKKEKEKDTKEGEKSKKITHKQTIYIISQSSD